MKKILLLILFSQILLAGTVFAQTGGQGYKLLEPIPYVETTPGNTNVQTYLPGIIKLAIALAGALAVIMIIIGGIQYMSTDAIGKKDGAKHTIQNAVWGFVLTLSAWLILVTINPSLVSIDLTLDAPKAGSSLEASPTGDLGTSGAPWGDDQAIRDDLSKSGIGVATPKCDHTGQTGCTSVLGLSSRVVTGLKGLKQKCGACEVFITGGTEYWLHVSHTQGASVVDLRSHDPVTGAENSLTKFIKDPKNGTRDSSAGCAGGEKYKTSFGGVFVLETVSAMNTGVHWHVCY